MVKKLKSRINDKVTNPKVVKSKAEAVRSRADKGMVLRIAAERWVVRRIDVVSRIDIHSFKSEEERENSG